MTPPPTDPVHGNPLTDATLVAWLDGELTAAEADDVSRKVAADDSLSERVRLLRSARNELAWALADSETTPPPAPLASTRRRSFAIGKWLMAAAAVAIVVAIGNWQPAEQIEVAENDLLAVKLTSPRTGWDLFGNIRFAVAGHAKTDVPCRIVARGTDETDAQLAARAVKENNGKPIVPMVLSATLTFDKRELVGDIAKAHGVFRAGDSSVSFRLVDMRTQYDGIAPLLALKPGDDGGSEDFKWCYQNGVLPHNKGNIGFVPTEIGEYRLSVKLRALATTANGAPAFAEPLEVAIGFTVRGVVGEWSEPVKGLRARFVASRGTADDKQLAVAVQVRNDSELALKYNVTGATMAKIPQPLHFDLLVDGQQWQQRDGLAVIHMAHSSFLPQPAGTTRSMIVLADYWHHQNRSPSQLRGKHKLGMRFHFTPLVWNTNDKSIWHGMIDTPPIELEFPPAK